MSRAVSSGRGRKAPISFEKRGVCSPYDRNVRTPEWFAQKLLEQALALDSDFALAHAALSQVHGQMYWFRYDPEDAFDGPPGAVEDRARILAQAGDAEAALDEIARLLAGPSWLSVHTLRLDPRWDPIREHPRFKALLANYDAPAVQ